MHRAGRAERRPWKALVTRVDPALVTRVARAVHGPWRRQFALLLLPLVVAIQLQRGLAEAHQDHAAPLTIEAPIELLPADLALWVYPAVVEDVSGERLRALAAASAARLGVLALHPERACHRAEPSRAAPRAPPLS